MQPDERCNSSFSADSRSYLEQRPITGDNKEAFDYFLKQGTKYC